MSNDKSAQPCGCDEGANHICARHRAFPAEDYSIIDRGGILEPGVFTLTAKLQAAHPESQKLWRKQRPLHSGVLAYFPDALMEVAYVSFLGNAQHNPGEPLHWAREKSTDHLDCIARHITDHSKNPVDDDGALHLAKAAWRALAQLQTYLEQRDQR